MSASHYRHRDGGGAIDRNSTIEFIFNGRRYSGLRGDTLASALLANGVRLVARSFKYHRPRGIMTCGIEEPNAIVQVLAPRHQPVALATTLPLVPGLKAASVNCWPGPRFDVGAINDRLARLLPAGFYYKTFMGPTGAWPFYERLIRRAAGLGVVDTTQARAAKAIADNGASANADSNADRNANCNVKPNAKVQFRQRRFAHCDLLIVGAGPAGLAAALLAARSGVRVMLADDQLQPGGSLAYGPIDSSLKQWIATTIAQLDALPNVRRLSATQVSGFYDHGFLTAVQQASPLHQVMWKMRARQVVIATGAIERPLLFADNDRPGVMLCSAVLEYLQRYAVVCGHTVVVACNNDSGHDAAHELLRQGIDVAAIVEVRDRIDPALIERARVSNVLLLLAHTVSGVRGQRAVRSARVAPLDQRAAGVELRCDLIAMSGGWNPRIHLHSQSGGKVVYDEQQRCFLPGPAPQASRCAGSANGRFETPACLQDGQAAAIAAVRALGGKLASSQFDSIDLPALTIAPATSDTTVAAATARWSALHRAGQKVFVDMANDVTTADLALAQREGYESVELVKRYTTTGMGIDQGKTSNVNAIGVLGDLRGVSPSAIGTTTFRPPYAPIEFSTIAGFEPGPLIRPARTTPMTAWHESNNAVMYESGANWRRPGYYPRNAETMADAIHRECLAVRERVGIYDSTPLGKFEVRGPGAAAFLEWVYAGAVADLKPGRGRYGLMLREDGRLLDDGVVFRIASDHFWVSTTSGNADAVYGWLQYLRQRAWTGATVFVVPVTAQWANAVVCGPKARAVLLAVGTDMNLSGDAFGFMAMREGTMAGLPARVFRVSFTGELSYEINVPARHGLKLWDALICAGREVGIAAIGSEANHVLRIEKGYISIGHEADGLVTPQDLGLGWAVRMAKLDFIGKRSLQRANEPGRCRRTLVGLLTEAPQQVLAEGAQLLAEGSQFLAEGGGSNSAASAGHVTASVMSPTVRRSIALALLDDGDQRLGQMVRVTVANGKKLTYASARVVRPVFYDEQGTHLRA